MYKNKLKIPTVAPKPESSCNLAHNDTKVILKPPLKRSNSQLSFQKNKQQLIQQENQNFESQMHHMRLKSARNIPGSNQSAFQKLASER